LKNIRNFRRASVAERHFFQLSFADPLGGFRMAEYQAYTVGRDGHFSGFEPLVCSNDTEAIEKAWRLVDGYDVELWSGARLVIRLSREPPE
jgi:hypothetical protein